MLVVAFAELKRIAVLKKKSVSQSGFWGERGNPPPHPHPTSTKYALQVLWLLTNSTLMGSLPFSPTHHNRHHWWLSLSCDLRWNYNISNCCLDRGRQLSNFHKFSVCTIFHSREECPPACVSLTAAQTRLWPDSHSDKDCFLEWDLSFCLLSWPEVCLGG